MIVVQRMRWEVARYLRLCLRVRSSVRPLCLVCRGGHCGAAAVAGDALMSQCVYVIVDKFFQSS